jgi:Cu/Ag efflux protein CusF
VGKFKSMSVFLVASSFLSFSAYAAETMPDTYKRTGENTVEASNTIEVEAQVVGIDKKTRELKLKAPNGDTTTIKAGDEVENFAQIKKGDRLKVRYLESLTLELKQGGGAPIVVSDTSDLVRAQPGQKPSAVASTKVTAVGTIQKIDKKNQSVTVKGPNRTVNLHVQKKDIFDRLKVGDQIEATYLEAVAVSVESVKK